MSDRLRVVRRGFTYPADAASLALIQEAGGFSKLAPDAQRQVRWKQVAIGDFCDDMPPASAAIFLERGDLERVPAAAPAARATKKGVR